MHLQLQVVQILSSLGSIPACVASPLSLCIAASQVLPSSAALQTFHCAVCRCASVASQCTISQCATLDPMHCSLYCLTKPRVCSSLIGSRSSRAFAFDHGRWSVSCIQIVRLSFSWAMQPEPYAIGEQAVHRMPTGHPRDGSFDPSSKRTSARRCFARQTGMCGMHVPPHHATCGSMQTLLGCQPRCLQRSSRQQPK